MALAAFLALGLAVLAKLRSRRAQPPGESWWRTNAALFLAIAAYGLIFGSRDGLQKAVWVVVGGVMLFSAESLVSFIAASSR